MDDKDKKCVCGKDNVVSRKRRQIRRTTVRIKIRIVKRTNRKGRLAAPFSLS